MVSDGRGARLGSEATGVRIADNARFEAVIMAGRKTPRVLEDSIRGVVFPSRKRAGAMSVFTGAG